jgi:uncharacterized membrane protein YecN with MAPEG domain
MATPGTSYSSTSTQPDVAAQKLQIQNALKGPASWFITVAVLSIVNSILSMTGASIHFIFGLGITQFVDAVAHGVGNAGYVLDLVINGMIAGLFVLIWNFARKGQSWAWYGGMALYAVDGVLLIFFQDYLSVAFHAWALFRMYPGIKLLPILRQFEQSSATGAVSSTF